jgi:hypothetical protein
MYHQPGLIGTEEVNRQRAGRDTKTKCLSQLEPGVPIHLLCPNPPRLLVYYYELLSSGVNWDRQGELGQAEGMGTIPKTNRISLLILERKGVPICPIWPNSPQLSQSTPMDSIFSRGTGFWVWLKGCQKRPQVRKLKPTKVRRSEFPKSNNHHTVVYLGKAVTSKPKKIKNRG